MGKGQRQDLSPERSYKDRIQKLTEIVRSQKKEIAQLKRELNRRDDVSDDYRALLEEVEAPLQPIRTKAVCPKCGNDVNETPLGKFTLESCTNCTWRSRKK